jgi:hypothetical protein
MVKNISVGKMFTNSSDVAHDSKIKIDSFHHPLPELWVGCLGFFL